MQHQRTTRQNNTTTKKRKRNITWFNPPYSANVVTKVGKMFLYLLDNHLTPHNNFLKIFIRSTVRIRCSCMPNMKTINWRNQNITNPEAIAKERNCNCVDKTKCPFNQKCLINNIIYPLQSSDDVKQPKLK